MQKQNPLYIAEEYVASKKNALKYLDRDTVDKMFRELLEIISKSLKSSLNQISENNKQPVAELIKSCQVSACNEILQKLKNAAESNWQYRFIYTPFAGVKDTEEEIYFYWLTDRAKHSNEVEYREVLQREIASRLRAEKQLTKPENDWLIYVLENVKIPHKAQGAPKRNLAAINRKYLLAKFILNKNAVNPKSKILERLNDAAISLCVSYETLRADYYSEEYKKIYNICYKLQSEN